jgi:hypothetical protein
MTNPNLLPPNILTAAETAWNRAQEKQEAWPFGSSTTYQSLGAASLHTLDAAVVRAREQGVAGFNGLDGITNLETRELFKRDLEDYETIFAGAGIDMPTPAELAEGGIDFRHLAELKETLPDHDLVVTPLTLPLESVRQLVSTVARDTTITKNPLKGGYSSSGSSGDGLIIAREAADNWDRAMASTVHDWQLSATNHEYKWTAFLLPNNEKTLEDDSLSLVETRREDRNIIPVSGYIAYQLCRIRRGTLPLTNYWRGWASSGEFTDLTTPDCRNCILTTGWNRLLGQIVIGMEATGSEGYGIRVCNPIE